MKKRDEFKNKNNNPQVFYNKILLFLVLLILLILVFMMYNISSNLTGQISGNQQGVQYTSSSNNQLNYDFPDYDTPVPDSKVRVAPITGRMGDEKEDAGGVYTVDPHDVIGAFNGFTFSTTGGKVRIMSPVYCIGHEKSGCWTCWNFVKYCWLY